MPSAIDPKRQRDLAIDVMRGLTLALMIVVNMSINEKLSYAPLLHAVWHGLTLTDLVFPSFLFVVGAAMSLTQDKQVYLGEAAFHARVLRRTALIFLCGYLLYWFPFFGTDAAGHWGLLPLAQTRIPGVLQRIALCYGFAALIVHHGHVRGAVVFSVLALMLNWWLMARFGDYTLAGNAGLRLDLWALGEAHLYRGEGVAFDPEGILGTLPAIVNVLAGWLAARFLRQRGKHLDTVLMLAGVGVACVVAAWAWHGVLPINKKLWTSSYVLVGVGTDLIVLATLVAVLDLLRLRGWTHFFEVLGKNTLFVYLLSEIGNAVMGLVHVGPLNLFDWLYVTAFQPWAGDKPGSLLYALLYMLVCWSVAWAMDRRRIYVKL
jgi:predicted acyltransferase